MADGDATIRLDQGGINARLLANEAKVDFRRVESASRKIQATFHSPEVKRLFVRYLNSMQLNMYLISVIGRTKLPHSLIAGHRIPRDHVGERDLRASLPAELARLRVDDHDLAIVPHRGFKRASRGRADGDDSSAGGTRSIHDLRSFIADREPFRRHPMLADDFRADGFKRSVTHVQGDLHDPDAARFNLLKDARSEVQTRGRSRNCSAFPGIYGLITLAVRAGLVSATLDVRRQRSLPNLVDDCVQGSFGCEPYHPHAVIKRVDHFRAKLSFTKRDPRAGSQAARRLG